MVFNNNYSAWNYASREDIRISYEDYYQITQSLLDERLSKKMIVKFKNIWEMNMAGAAFTPIFAFLPTLWMTRLLTGPARRAHSGYRYNWVVFSFFWPFTTLLLCSRPIPRRLYTEVLTDDGDDGTYIRSTLKYKNPGIWRKLSTQLHQKGYDFPEINENHNNTQFPSDFVGKY